MNTNHRIARRVLAWTAVATLGIGAVAGVAVAATSAAPGSSPSASAQDKSNSSGKDNAGKHGKHGKHGNHQGRLGALARHTVHGEFVIKDKDGKYVTTDSQRGSVTAVSPTSITVRSSDGFTTTYVVNADTRVRKAGAKAEIGAVKAGDEVFVLATKEAGGKTARGLVVGEK